MTEKDLRLQYKRDTGEYPTYSDSTDLPESPDFADIVKYVVWLEEIVIEANKYILEENT